MQPIKMVDLHRQYLTIKDEIDQTIQSVLDSSEFIMGRVVDEFEHELSQYLEAKFVIGCASGTDALLIAMMAMEIGPGDEVITSPFSFAAAAEAIAFLGARPVYVDIDSRTYNIDPNLISDGITQKTKAILPVHLFGQSADMEPILSLAQENDLKVIEDSAQSIGARYHNRFVGTLGDIGCLSFYPTKNLGAYGDAGALLTNDSSLAQTCRMITEHGSRVRYHHETLGINSRLDSLQAAVLKVKLKHLDVARYEDQYEPLLRERLAQMGRLKQGAVVLCLGARRGAEVRAFRHHGAIAVGLDLNPGERNPHVLRGDFHAVPFQQESIDVAFTNSLDHVFEVGQFISEIRRVLKPAGLLVVEAIQGRAQGSAPDSYASFWWDRLDDVVALFAASGFRLCCRNAFAAPWPGEQFCFEKMATAGQIPTASCAVRSA